MDTVAAMALSAVFSLPLLVLHVAAVLGFRFALTRILPLAGFSLGLVVNGVYGAGIRDYIFIGAIVLVIAYLTITFPSWASRRERHRQESDNAYAAARTVLKVSIIDDMGRQVADLKAAGARAESQLKMLASGEGTAPARSALEAAREPVPGLGNEHEELLKRLAALPVHRDWPHTDLLTGLQRDVEGFRERVDVSLARLRAELENSRAPAVVGAPAGETHHCAACGQAVVKAPFCQQCGAVQPVVIVCPQCGDKNVLPVHFFPNGVPSAKELCCTSCGATLTAMVRLPRTDWGGPP